MKSAQITASVYMWECMCAVWPVLGSVCKYLGPKKENDQSQSS